MPKIVNKSELDILMLSSLVEENFKLQPSQKDQLNMRSTIFSYGSDTRLSSTRGVSTPDFFLIELLEDQLKQSFVRLRWFIDRKAVGGEGIIGFNIWRKRNSATILRDLSVTNLAKLAGPIKGVSKFSSNNNLFTKIKSGLIPQSILNFSLFEQQSNTLNRFSLGASTEEPTRLTSTQEFTTAEFENIGFVDISKFTSKEKPKKVFVEDINSISLFYDDKKAKIGEQYEYYITTVTSFELDARVSDIISVDVINKKRVDVPQIRIKQKND